MSHLFRDVVRQWTAQTPRVSVWLAMLRRMANVETCNGAHRIITTTCVIMPHNNFTAAHHPVLQWVTARHVVTASSTSLRAARHRISSDPLGTVAAHQIYCVMTTAVIIVSGIHFPSCGKQLTFGVTARLVIIVAVQLIRENSARSTSPHH